MTWGTCLLPDSETEKVALSLVSPEAPLGEGDHKERGLTLLGHGQPPAQKGKQLLWSYLLLCGPASSPNKNARNTNSTGEQAEGRSWEESHAEPAQEHRTAIQVNTKIPCRDFKAPRIKTWGRGFQGPPVSAGVRCAWSAQEVLTVGAVDAGVLVVAEEKATVALTLVAAHGIDADLLAAAIVVLTLIHICKKRGEEQSHPELDTGTQSASQTAWRRSAEPLEWLVTMLSRGWLAPTCPRGRHCSQHLTCTHSSNPHRSPVSQIWALTHLTDKETEVQRGKATWPRFHTGKIQTCGLTPTPGLSLMLLDPPPPSQEDCVTRIIYRQHIEHCRPNALLNHTPDLQPAAQDFAARERLEDSGLLPTR